MHSHQQRKCRKKRFLQAEIIKTVTLTRGKFGYGFTISGENPCVLSCIVAGSPAHTAGLKAGDHLYAVNAHVVSRAAHDDVVRIVGLSTSSIHLQVAEKPSSVSSDEDDFARSKPCYPHQVKTYQSRRVKSKRTSSSSLVPRLHLLDNKTCEHLHWSTSPTTQEYQPSFCHTNNAHLTGQQSVHFFEDQSVLPTVKSISAAAMAKRVAPATHHTQQHKETMIVRGQEGDNVSPSLVGYMGSIETTSSHKHPHQRLQTIRNAVKRLRLEERVHTLVLMEVTPLGVLLTNLLGKQLAFYPCDRIVYSGICLDDERFFGLVTLIGSGGDASLTAGEQSSGAASSSCHIFMTETNYNRSRHHVPVDQTQCVDNFKFEKPQQTAKSMVLCLTSMHQNKTGSRFDNDIVQSHVLADPTCEKELGDQPKSDKIQNDQVCVVEMPGPLEDSCLLVNANNSRRQLSDNKTVSVQASVCSDVSSSRTKVNSRQLVQAGNLLRSQVMADTETLSLVKKPLKQNTHRRYLDGCPTVVIEEQGACDYLLSLSVSEDGCSLLESGSNRRQSCLPIKPLHQTTGKSAHRVSRSPINKSSKPVTVDVDTINKLSPRAFPNSSPASCSRFMLSPSTLLFPHHDSDEDKDDDWESEEGIYLGHFLEQYNNSKHETVINQNNKCLAIEENSSAGESRLIEAWSRQHIAASKPGCNKVESSSVAAWAIHFDNLLLDQVGVHVFTEFLENEFSSENIKFWQICEHFRAITNTQQLQVQAKEIFARYLSPEAPDPVNIDSTARTCTQNLLDQPTAEMFDVAQQQIKQLMKQDSYPRFLKSQLYQRLLLQADDQHKVTFNKHDKITGKENVSKRRKSLLLWKHVTKPTQLFGFFKT